MVLHHHILAQWNMYQVGSIKDMYVLASEHDPNTPMVILPSTYRDLETPRINQVLLILIYPLLLLHLEMRVLVRLPTYLSLKPHHIVPIDWNIHIDRAIECCFYLFLLVLWLHAGREPLWLGWSHSTKSQPTIELVYRSLKCNTLWMVVVRLIELSMND
jgi:hypothetical protein